MKRHNNVIGGILGILVLSLATPASYAALLEVLGSLPGGPVGGEVFAISRDGTTVGGYSYSRDYQEGDCGAEAFMWTASDGMVGLGGLPGLASTATYGLSGDGTVAVGIAGYGEPHSARAFRWDASGGMSSLGTLGAAGSYNHSYACAVSDDGSIVVGGSTSPNGYEAFRWTTEDGMIGLGDLPGGSFTSRAKDISANGTVIVGTAREDGSRAFRWTASDGMASLPLPVGANDTRAEAVSADGLTIVGTADFGSGIEGDGLRWTSDGGFETLGVPGPDTISVNPRDVSGDGSIVVGWYGLPVPGDPGGQFLYAFIWDEDHGTRDFKQFLTDECGLSGLDEWYFAEATAISGDGTFIAGYGTRPDGQGGWEDLVWRVTVPEPGGAIGIAVVFLCACRRRED